jgi:hypothetical protein
MRLQLIIRMRKDSNKFVCIQLYLNTKYLLINKKDLNPKTK